MCSSWRLMAALVFLIGAAPIVALPEPDEKELAANRRKLEELRRDPSTYDRLKRDWRAFRALSPEKQGQIRQLHHDLHQEDSDTQARLDRVLDRYAAWLEGLSDDDLKRIQSATNADERLQVIQELREQEWLSRLPRAVREQVHASAADKRPALVSLLRQQERQRRQDWQRVIKQRPVRPNDFPVEIQTFIEHSLRPLLTDEEKQRLKNVEGKAAYATTLIELVERHPIRLPPSPTIGPKSIKDSKELRQKFPPKTDKMLDKVRLAEVDGKWPDYALYLAEVARSKKITLSQPLGPSRPKEYSQGVQQFIEKELSPKLSDEDRKRLLEAEGQWPEFPFLLQELAKKYKLQIPGMTLPGQKEFWDSLRAELPEVPDRILRDFALTQLTREDLAELQLTSSDPLSRERLKQKFFERNPDELKRIRMLDADFQARKSKNKF